VAVGGRPGGQKKVLIRHIIKNAQQFIKINLRRKPIIKLLHKDTKNYKNYNNI
jgi:hypothetical protein